MATPRTYGPTEEYILSGPGQAESNAELIAELNNAIQILTDKNAELEARLAAAGY